MPTGLPLPQFSWLTGVMPGPVNVSVEQPLSLVTGLVRTSATRWPTLPWKVRFAVLPGVVIFMVTAGPLMVTVQQLAIVVVVAAWAIVEPPAARSAVAVTVSMLRTAACALWNPRILIAPPLSWFRT